MADKSFEFRFNEKQLIALQNAAKYFIDPWDEEDSILEDLAEVFAQALNSRQR